jgi:hypothetical protein
MRVPIAALDEQTRCCRVHDGAQADSDATLIALWFAGKAGRTRAWPGAN